MRRNFNNFQTFRSNNNQPLSMHQIAQWAPSALAVAAHESRSERYTYVPTLEIIKALDKEGFLPFMATQSKSRLEGRRSFTKHMLRFRHVNAQAMSVVGDSVPEVVLINSHDGTSVYKLIAGIFRLVCSNGMVVAEETSGSVNVRHQGNIIDNVIEGSYQVIEGARKSVEVIKQWSQLQLTNGEQQAFAESAHLLRFADNEGKTDTPISATQLLQSRRYQDNGNDLWKTFNRVQENVIKGGLAARIADPSTRRGTRRVSMRSVNGINEDVKLNRALWSLAEKMAELKTA